MRSVQRVTNSSERKYGTRTRASRDVRIDATRLRAAGDRGSRCPAGVRDPRLPRNDEELAGELTRMFFSYLGVRV